MAPIKCSYFGCNNTSKITSIFRFPTGDTRRLEIWLSNCGNMTINHLNHDELRNRYICMKHFDNKFIRNKTGKRTHLIKSAIPRHYKEYLDISPHSPSPSTSQGQGTSPLKVLTPTKVYQRKIFFEETPSEPGLPAYLTTHQKRRRLIDDPDTPKCRKLKHDLQISTKMLRQERKKCNYIRKRISGVNIINLDKHEFQSDSSKILTLMQLRNNKRQWSDAEKEFCMSLYYKSPAAYKHLINAGIVLASPTTIQHWLQATNCLPGLNKDIFCNVEKSFVTRM